MLEVQELLKVADELIFAKTGKHLDNLQQAILKGTLEGKTYTDIADLEYCTANHVKDVGSQLWKILSEALGEDVKKSNFRATLERLRLCNISHFGRDFIQISKFNICSNLPPKESPHIKKASANQVKLDLDNAPSRGIFYGRVEEINLLKQWIIKDSCRLVAISGMSGMGKTTLSVQLIEQIKDKFEYIIYRSLYQSPTFETLQINLKQVFADEVFSDLLGYLRQHRCLIILDDVQMLFSNGKLAGEYKSGYENYSLFFKTIAEVEHQSCLLINTQEAPREVIKYAGEPNPVRCLCLPGLGLAAKYILKDRGLIDEEKWTDLINYYQGNPLWLNIAAIMIKDLFAGKVEQYLKYDIILPELQEILNLQLQRLSETEQKLISKLSVNNKPVCLNQLITEDIATSDLFNSLQSLTRRSLIEKQEINHETYFNLIPVIKQYVNSFA